MKRTIVVVVCLAWAVAACGHDLSSDVPAVLDALPRPATTTTVRPSEGTQPTTTTSPSQGECEEHDLATKSLRPDDRALAGDSPDVEAIRAAGVLRVGVDENTLGLSSRNTETGDIEGFEVDLARAIAARIFGDDRTDRVDLVPVVTAEKRTFVQDGKVDMTISANSMTCSRWEEVAFSTEYYTADQKFLVREGSPIRSLSDLAGKRVCVTTGSSSDDLLRRHVPEVDRHLELDRTGCLLALQEGTVDAYFGHDSFLYGMLPQDRNVEIRTILPPDLANLAVSHYGIAIARDRPDLVRFVNATLEEIRVGTWRTLHELWLEDELDMPPASPPTARYRD